MIETLSNIPNEIWLLLYQMSPYLLLGFGIAGFLSVVISQQFVERHLGGNGVWPIVKATLFGIPLPLCSCGVLPVAASIKNHGASKGSTTSFLISTPQTGVDSIMITYSLLGPVFAIARPLIALVSGVIGGLAVSIFEKNESKKHKSQTSQISPHQQNNNPKRTYYESLIEMIRYGFIELPKDLAFSLVIGIIIAAFISTIIPSGFLEQFVGSGILSMLFAMLIGIPLYVCATGSVPIAAAMIGLGLSPGAILVFLMTGPATNAAALTTISKVLGKKTMVIYLLSLASIGLLSGIAFDAFTNTIQMNESLSMDHEMGYSGIGIVSTIILLAILIFAIFEPWFSALIKKDDIDEKKLPSITFQVEGMTCNNCARSVSRSLSKCVGVEKVDVDFQNNKVSVFGTNLDLKIFKEIVQKLGFSTSNNSDY